MNATDYLLAKINAKLDEREQYVRVIERNGKPVYQLVKFVTLQAIHDLEDFAATLGMKGTEDNV